LPGKNISKILIICGVIGTAATVTVIALHLAISRLNLRLKDRTAAAEILCDILKSKFARVTEAERKRDIIVVGIPRGGVKIADIVATKLSTDFDILVAAKVGEPENKESAIAAITEDGTTYLNRKRVNELRVSAQYVQTEMSAVKQETMQRAALYRGDPTLPGTTIKGRTVILVDDGVATGATIIAAARSIRKQSPKYLIIAVPVVPREVADQLEGETDSLQIIISPSSPDFVAVAQFYQEFLPVTNDQVVEIMKKWNRHFMRNIDNL
jgi:putative phosphoribosyl transferase